MPTSNYVLLDGSNTVLGTALWDGTSTFEPGGVVTKHLLPSPPPAFRTGDTYNPATDVVTPRADTLAETQIKNQAVILAKGQAALNANNTFLAIGSPTNAQVLAQVQLLTKEVNGLLRAASRLLDSTSDT